MEKKRKVKKSVKRSSNILFVIILILLVIFYIYKTSTLKDNKKDPVKDPETKEELKSEEVKEETSKEKVNNFKKISNYRKENLNRYEAYKEKNPDLSDETIVTYVNIGLDYEFYGLIKDTDMSKGILIIVNKYNKLPGEYEADDLEEISSEYFVNGNTLVRKLRKEAKEAFEKMSKASIENGTPVYGQSAYRPYSMQKKIYDQEVENGGVEYADRDTARPGHSEHQTGLAIDVASEKWGNMYNFANTSSYEWMENNAHKYGFILRYRNGYESIHGYIYEGWHYRYVGVKVATEIHNHIPEITYEEYYDKYINKID